MPVLPLLANFALVAAFIAAGFHLSRRASAKFALPAAATALAAIGYGLEARPDIHTRLFPFAGLLFFSNHYPLASALIVPLAIRTAKGKAQRIRVAILCAILLGASLWPMRYFWLPAAEAGAAWIDENGICRQTSSDTCSPAAAVTLLKSHGIEATEAETARLAFTRAGSGTRTLGQYRALKILVARSGKDLKVRVRKTTAEEALNGRLPAVVTAGLPRKLATAEEAELAEKYQWKPGIMHDVVLFGHDPADRRQIVIGEPDFGRENWMADQFRCLYRNYLVRLE